MDLVLVISSNPLSPLWVLDQGAPIRTRQTLTMLAGNLDLAGHHRVVAQLLSLVVDSRDPLLVRQALGVLAKVAQPAVRDSLAKAIPRIPDTLNACLALHICQEIWPVRNWFCQSLLLSGEQSVGRVLCCQERQGIVMYWQVEPPHSLEITLLGDSEQRILTQGKPTGIAALKGYQPSQPWSPALLRILLNHGSI